MANRQAAKKTESLTGWRKRLLGVDVEVIEPCFHLCPCAAAWRDGFKCVQCGWSRADLSRDDPRKMLELQQLGPRGVLLCWATDKDDPTEEPRWGRVGKQKIEDTGTSHGQ